MDCPDYRLRLFMSVDLVGSTAFKGGRGAVVPPGATQPLWVRELKKFYFLFPEHLRREFLRSGKVEKDADRRDPPAPLLWKRIGDELVFCCRLESLEHLARCVLAFVNALDEYGNQLDSDGKHLDVKGGAWIAAFPFPNLTVRIADDRAGDIVEYGEALPEDIETEELEAAADEIPSRFDFLGPGIDGGFRITKFASSDRCVLTVETAWLLAKACSVERKYPLKFFYHDRQILKGVLQERPYPVFSIDTERSVSRKEVLFRENLITKRDHADARLIADFLIAFMTDEAIEPPSLASLDTESCEPPASHEEFTRAWQAKRMETAKRSELERASLEAPTQAEENGETGAITLDRLKQGFEQFVTEMTPRRTSPEEEEED
ncbi:hypothetical protein GCM10011390_29860 [Aureimonas endophytica]|uniref:Uncharacterized protein n=1 Tax=Aureimonas endophytica TaxID=2027858 RepID=A0A917E6C6_9HYPH|nr:hypothetical protein [Aureimonas endophytica]GGE08834.1 hypothetical protein GCM10011390_29860 [Aureimonas endophytica]